MDLLHTGMINFFFTGMINFFLRHSNGACKATSAQRFRLREAFLNNSRKTTRKRLHACPITFSNNDSIVGLRLQACASAPADGKFSNPSMRPSC